MGAWIKVQEYAFNHQISQQAVRNRIKTQKLLSKKIKGRMCVYDPELEGDGEAEEANLSPELEPNSSPELEAAFEIKEAKRLENELRKERLKNLKQDTLIKKQKQTFTKQKYRAEFVEAVFASFSEAFADLKNIIIALQLNKEQMQNFQATFKKNLKKFENCLKKYLMEADKKQMEDEEK